MSNKIFETDSDLEIASDTEEKEVNEIFNEETKRIEEVEEPKAPKVKAKGQAKKSKLLEPADDNTQEVNTDELGEPKKKRKKRQPMTEERKAQLLANLEKGRLKALENRKKKAQVKKIIKKKKEEEMDTLIQEDLVAKKTQANEKNKLREDLDEMKLMMKNLMEENNKLKSSTSKAVSAPAPALKTIKEEETPAPAPAPAPVPTPLPQRNNHISRGIKSRWDKYKK